MRDWFLHTLRRPDITSVCADVQHRPDIKRELSTSIDLGTSGVPPARRAATERHELHDITERLLDTRDEKRRDELRARALRVMENLRRLRALAKRP
jgi:hypothetical protein